MTSKGVVVISGGLDSSTLLHKVKHDYPSYELYGISFNYGQRHAKELDYARQQCEAVGASHTIANLEFLGKMYADAGSHSSLISDEEVPEGHYAEANMAATVVPNRNMIMMSIAAGYTVSVGARLLALGVHGGDHFIYPDCRPEFFSLMDRAIYTGNEGFIKPNFELLTPYMFKTKTNIAFDALKLGVDLSKTWSCYKGGEKHCGKCGTCVERLEAIHVAVLKMMAETSAHGEGSESYESYDSTEYEDTDFWKEALKRETV